MEHGPVPSQGVNAGGADARLDGVMVLPADQKALHADHGAAHHGVLIETYHGERHVSARSGNGKDDLIPQRRAEHGHQGGGDVDLTRIDLWHMFPIAGQVIGEEAVAPFSRLQSDERPLAVRLLAAYLVIGEDDLLHLHAVHLGQGGDLPRQSVQIWDLGHPGGQCAKSGPVQLTGHIPPRVTPYGEHRPQGQRHQKQQKEHPGQAASVPPKSGAKQDVCFHRLPSHHRRADSHALSRVSVSGLT